MKFKSYSALHSARVRVLAGGAAVRALRGTVLSVVADELGVEWQVPATGADPNPCTLSAHQCPAWWRMSSAWSGKCLPRVRTLTPVLSAQCDGG